MIDSVLDSTTETTDEHASADNLENVLLRTLAEADEPLTIGFIEQKLPRPYRGNEARLAELLGEHVDRGRVYQFSPYRGKAPRFWDRSPIAYAEMLLTTQTYGRFATRSELITQFKARCRDVSLKDFEALIKRLAQSEKLRSGKFLGSRAVRYSSDPIDAMAVAGNALEQIAKRFSLSQDQLRQLVAKQLSAFGVSPAGEQDTDEIVAVVRDGRGTNVDDGATELIWDAIAELCPEGGGSIVPIAQLRRVLAFKVDRETLDESLRSLESDGRIDFTVHPDPGGLTKDQRGDLLSDHAGKVFDMLIVRR